MPAFLAPLSVMTTGNYVALGSNPASTGAVRLPSAGAVVSRNGANTGDFILMTTDSGNQLFLSTGANASSAVYFGDRSTDKSVTVQAASSVNDLLINASSAGPTITLGNYGSVAASSGKTGIQSVSGRPVGVAFTSSTFDIMSGGFGGTKVAEFGATYLALGTNPASTGMVRLPNNQGLFWRNAANTGDFGQVFLSNTNRMTYEGNAGHIWYNSGVQVMTHSAGGLDVSGYIATAGLTGATAASRLVGATTSGAPATGTFAKGDLVIDQTGRIWINTTAGTPGTWTNAGDSGGFWSDAKWGVD